jgi:hypothetical protein
MAQHPFASPAWIGALRDYLELRAGELGALLDGARFSVCEVYEDVPAEVNASSTVRVHWAVGPDGLEFDEQERDDVDLKVVAPWAVIAPLARIAVRGDAERATALRRGLGAGLRDGSIRATARGESPPFMDQVHDDMAEQTA